MHFLIYLPKSKAAPEDLANVGLGDLVAEALTVDCRFGPDRTAGTLFGWRPKSGQLLIDFRPDAQTWLPAVAFEELPAARYWVGLWNDSPPTPGDLQRAYPFAGDRIDLGDGHKWIIPTCEKLPADMIRADDGSWRFVVQRRFHDFTLLARAMADRIHTHHEWPWWEEMADLVDAAIRLNYRLTPEVTSYLRLWQAGDGQSVNRALLAILRPALLTPHRPE